MDHIWLTISHDDLQTEQLQAEEEGRDLSGVLQEFKEVRSMPELDQDRAAHLLDKVQTHPLREDYTMVEPNKLGQILLEAEPTREAKRIKPPLDKMHGAWLGRCCGCLLGKVTEGWRRPQMEGFLKETGQWPLSYYISRGSDPSRLEKFGLGRKGYAEDITCMPEDDDLNYTVTAFEILRTKGRDFEPRDVAEIWMNNIPILHTCTAERVAYKNFVNSIWPPD